MEGTAGPEPRRGGHGPREALRPRGARQVFVEPSGRIRSRTPVLGLRP